MGDINKSFPFKVSMKTDPAMFEFESFIPGVMERFVIADSIYNYFPYFELVLRDDGSIFTELNYFTEFLDLKLKLSDPTDKYLVNHDFYWSEFQVTDPTSQEVVAGIVVLPMKSSFLKQDEVSNKSYRGDISSVVRQIMSKYSYPNNVPDMKISSTANYDIWYKSQEYDYRFIRRLAKYALSPTAKNSPYFSFIDSKGQFHFQSLADLFNQKSELDIYYGLQGEVTQYNRDLRNDVINGNYAVKNLGSPNNMKTYKSQYYKMNESGEYESDTFKISDKLDGNRIGQNKQSIRKQYIDKIRSIEDFGIIDDFYQKSHYKGWVNNHYIDSATFPYRLRVDINLNLQLCSGKMITVNYMSANEEKDNKALEYSGDWLILECAHMVGTNGDGITSLELGKSSINIHKKHKFYPDFI